MVWMTTELLLGENEVSFLIPWQVFMEPLWDCSTVLVAEDTLGTARASFSAEDLQFSSQGSEEVTGISRVRRGHKARKTSGFGTVWTWVKVSALPLSVGLQGSYLTSHNLEIFICKNVDKSLSRTVEGFTVMGRRRVNAWCLGGSSYHSCQMVMPKCTPLSSALE